MSIELKIVALDAADLKKQLADLLSGGSVTIVAGVGSAGEGATASGAVSTAPKAAKAKPEKPEIVEAKVEDVAVAEEAPAAEVVEETNVAEIEAAVEAGTLTYEGDIKPAVLKVSAKHGRPGVEKLLADFEAANAKEIPEAKWPELLAAIDKLLA